MYIVEEAAAAAAVIYFGLLCVNHLDITSSVVKVENFFIAGLGL